MAAPSECEELSRRVSSTEIDSGQIVPCGILGIRLSGRWVVGMQKKRNEDGKGKVMVIRCIFCIFECRRVEEYLLVIVQVDTITAS